MTIVVEAVAPTVSVTVTVSVSVPAAAFVPTVTMPDPESMVMPVVVGEILNTLVPVPELDGEVKALDVFKTPTVVVIFEPPPIATMESTTMATLIDLEIFKLSVAVTLSLIVPTGKPARSVMRPDTGSIEI